MTSRAGCLLAALVLAPAAVPAVGAPETTLAVDHVTLTVRR